jgi:uncharacterized protein (TIGR00251 family)
MTTPAGPISQTPTGVRVSVRVVPRAAKDEIAGLRDGRILIRVTAPPIDSAANEAVAALLADRLHVRRRAVRIASGQTSRSKLVDIDGVSAAAVADLLTALA